ncbi:MAG: PepSY domain-containing protein [Coriobacteriales bacterium]|nr:PepSY domain-containing protein [Coriobacteriales bacterium]
MTSKKLATFAVATALAGCLGLVGCGGSQEAAGPAASDTATEAATDATADTSTQTTSESTTSNAAQDEQANASNTAETDATAQTTTPTETTDQALESTSTSASTTESYIGEEAAKTAALTHASVAQADAIGLKAELDLDDGAAHYDVEFTAGGVEYDYNIDAFTGDVLSYESEVDD